MPNTVPCIWILAGTNGAGKSSIAGAMLRESGGDYRNPDEVATQLRERNVALDPTEANALAWKLGLHWRDRKLLAPKSLRKTPTWAKPIVAQALKHTEK